MKTGSLDEMLKIANVRGGKCLSLAYSSAHTKLAWQCQLGHVWEANPNNIKNGTWCPACSKGIGERVCRLIFEKIFQASFPSVFPDWLKSPVTQRKLELDGYCQALAIAFEYNGEQHYTDDTLYPQSQYDSIKILMCHTRGIRLFVIEGIDRVGNYDRIIDQIKMQSLAFGIVLPTITSIDINDVYKTNKSELFLQELREISHSRNGRCLSTNYISSNHKLQFQCNVCDYIWEASPNAIKNGTWCPKCANKCVSIDEAITIAHYRNGKCLSTQYTDSLTKMQWECELGHQWQASYNQIQSGGWCPKCFENNRGQKKKIGIDAYQDAAAKKNGKCLSETISSCYDKLEWQCSEEHTWFARADLIKNTKQWCPQCARNKKTK